MHRMLLLRPTELLDLHPVRCQSLVFRRRIITPLALRARQNDLFPRHDNPSFGASGGILSDATLTHLNDLTAVSLVTR